MRYIAPSLSLCAFSCPNCGAFAHQVWYEIYLQPIKGLPSNDALIEAYKVLQATLRTKLDPTVIPSLMDMKVMVHGSGKKELQYTLASCWLSRCQHCQAPALWCGQELVHPRVVAAEFPHSDMPEHVREDFEEARQIADLSPRAAAALLRLALQKLLYHLGYKQDRIYDQIAAAVKDGLDRTVSDALDTLRVIGNEAVHPGQMDLKDNPEVARRLFKVLNYIVQKCVTDPKERAELLAMTPESARAQIERRNAKCS
ncbi:DUF4145 domain-containing protein [Geminicoccus flavidas]|uniref:DUF4145 domain-containing protein n=1 Tax=Geminicoccus flavidas TaxID=2506407 RepID=UPI00135B8475|nr:DUF4145 domain-containing protein [Geminicoccus flavidas]